MELLKIAVQKKGRLTDDSVNFLKKLGLRFDVSRKTLRVKAKNFPAEILFLRASDIPEFLHLNIVDLAILGENVIEEKAAKKVSPIAKLNFGKCKVCLAVPKGTSKSKIKKIATSYPHTTRKNLKGNFEIIPFSGSVELAPSLGIADAVVDIVETGETLRTHGLKIVETIFSSEAVLVSSQDCIKNKHKKELVGKIASFARAAMLATNKKYLMMNIAANLVDKIKKEISSMDSFTIIPLAKKNFVAVHTVINEDELWVKVEKLKKIGASGILIFDIEKVFP